MPDVTVSVDDEHLERIDGVVQALDAAGLRVTQVLPDLGVITGSVEDGDLRSALAQVSGVMSVDTDVTYQLPPADAEVQ